MSSVERAFQILELLKLERLSFVQIYTALQLPKSTAWNILAKLETIGAVEKDSNGEYALGSAMWRLGLFAANNITKLKELAEPFIRNLANDTKELCLLCMLDKSNMEIVYVSKFQGESPIHVNATVGSSHPCYCTSSGKLFLSYLSVEELDNYLDAVPLKAFTSTTITDRQVFKEELQKIRTSGYSIDRGEYIEYSIAVSAPIFNHEGRCVAVLVVSGLNQRVKERLDIMISQLKSRASEISEVLGYG